MAAINFNKIIEIVYNAGQKIKPYFGNIREDYFKRENAADSVTKLDQKIEIYLESELKKIDSSIGFKGEEFGSREEAERFWLVDPVDGTGLLIRGIQGCTTMLALIEEGEIKASIIYDFILDELYHAKAGEGTFVNKQRISVSDRILNNAILYAEIDPSNPEVLPFFVSLNEACVIMAGYPAGIQYAQTASGKVEGRLVFNGWGKDYDFAPGALLVKEAGGVVTNIGSTSFDYKNYNHLAVNPEVYKQLTSGEHAIFPIENWVVGQFELGLL